MKSHGSLSIMLPVMWPSPPNTVGSSQVYQEHIGYQAGEGGKIQVEVPKFVLELATMILVPVCGLSFEPRHAD